MNEHLDVRTVVTAVRFGVNFLLTGIFVFLSLECWSFGTHGFSEAGGAAVLQGLHSAAGVSLPAAVAFAHEWLPGMRGYVKAWIGTIFAAGFGWMALLGSRTVILSLFRLLSNR